MRHLLKYLSLYERLCSSAIILCALFLWGAFLNPAGYEIPHWPAMLSFIILLLAVIIKLRLSDIGKKAIQRGVEVG